MADNSEKNKRIAKNAVFLYVRMFVVLLISLYTTRVVLQSLGATDYGIYNVVCGFVSMFAVLSSTMSTGTNRYYNYEIGVNGNNAITRVFNSSFRIQIIISTIIVLLVETIGLWYLNNKMVIPIERIETARWIFQFSIISMVVVIFKTPFSAAVMACEKMDFFAVMGIFDALMKLVVALLIRYSSTDQLRLYGMLMMLTTVIDFLMYYGYCKFKIKEIKLEKENDNRLFKSMLKFSGWLMLDPLSYTLRGQGSNVVLNHFFGPIVNAAYGLSNQINGALDTMGSSLSTAFRPQMIQSYGAREYDRSKRLMYSMSKITCFLKIMLCLPLLLELKYISALWLGDEIPEYTLVFMKFAICINIVNTLNIPITQLMLATGNIKRYMIFTSIIISSIIPLSIVAFHLDSGPVAIYIIMLVLAIFNQCICVIILSINFQQVRLLEYLKEVFYPCIIQLLCVGIVMIAINYIYSSGLIRLLIGCLLSMIVSFLSAYYLTFNSFEKDMVNGFISKFIKR